MYVFVINHLTFDNQKTVSPDSSVCYLVVAGCQELRSPELSLFYISMSIGIYILEIMFKKSFLGDFMGIDSNVSEIQY